MMTPAGYQFSPVKFLQPFQAGDYLAVAQEMLQFFNFFLTASIDDPTDDEWKSLEAGADIIFHIIADPRFVIPEQYALKFAICASLLSNLARVTRFGTTDRFLAAINGQPNNLPKILSLYTPRNTLEIPLKSLFEANPALATSWWSMLSNHFRGLIKEDYHRYRRWLLDEDAWRLYTISENDYAHNDWLTHPGFAISYLDPSKEKQIRTRINEEFTKIIPGTQDQVRLVRKAPLSRNFKNILVVSYAFRKGSAIHKATAGFYQSLKGHYRLTYLNCLHNPKGVEMDTSLFDEIINAFGDDGGLTKEAFKALQEGDYGIIIFPDTSLCFNSSALAASRLAPIQITTYGHPVSSWSPEMDYFIGGHDTESHQTYGNYSERLILLPGNGNCPLPVEYTPSGAPESEEYRICCSWGYIKMNWEMLDLLRRLRDKSQKEIKFFFTDIQTIRLDYLAAKKDVEQVLGASAIVSRSLPRAMYLQNIESCRFAIDSWPFGGFNRVLDILAIGKPIIIREGDRAYNRMNAALLKRIGLRELVVYSPEQVIRKSLEIINNEDYRQTLIEKIKAANLYNPEDAKYFRKAIDFLVDNHDALQTFKNSKPIMIKQDET